ncbi:terminase small subunit [Dolosicoccus paucivorans]|uniref:terminase small subunit n=1 Tax=Dolosicoccus paucivorans TaxID=84521 RepID=UPI000B8154C2|nr:terminase small subunit [Dolosicoccus paucivorans]
MEDLNLRQQKFVEEYVASGNAKQSAIKAGYSENSAEGQGVRLLRNAKVSEAIKKRSKEYFDELSMTVEEALAITASIARGEPQRSYFKQVDKITGIVEIENERLVTPSIEDRQRSLDHIFKVSGAYLDKKEITATVDTNPLDKMISQLKGDQ